MTQARYPSYSNFLERPERVNGFVRQTYTHFMTALAGMLGVGLIAYHLLPEDELFLPVAILDVVLWIACGWCGWRRPIGFVFPLFTVTTGTFLGLLAERYTQQGLGGVFASASLVTLIAFAGLTAYVFWSRKNFNGLIGFLIVGFWILIAGMVLRLFFDLSLLQYGLSIFGAVVFSAWVLFDTSRILHQDDPTLTPQIAAFELFLDIIGQFSYILDLFDFGDVFDFG